MTSRAPGPEAPACAPPPAETERLPRVAILGRPNVGKSTLFNRLVGRRLAIVDDRPGVTRDRREGRAELLGLAFVAIDTAGLEDAAEGTLAHRMSTQALAALDEADAALFLVDARTGLTEDDRHFARELRARARVPVLLVANKAEGRAGEAGVWEAHALGLGAPIAVSAEHGLGLADLHEALAAVLPRHRGAPGAEAGGEPDLSGATAGPTCARDNASRGPADSVSASEPPPAAQPARGHAAPGAVDAAAAAADSEASGRPVRIAVVGRPNAGKSTLVNRLLGEERLLTGPEAGITRDAVAIPFRWKGRPLALVDTAGLRRRARVEDRLERLSTLATKRAIDFADVVVLLVDATRGLEAQDLRIADMVLEEGRALLVALGKWDAVEDGSRRFQETRRLLEERLAQVRGLPLLTVSGATGRGLPELMDASLALADRWNRRLSTAVLNRWFTRALARNPPPAPGGRRVRLRYVTQASARPPTFIVFGTRVDRLPESYRRYLANALRDELGLEGVPVRLHLRSAPNPYAPA